MMRCIRIRKTKQQQTNVKKISRRLKQEKLCTENNYDEALITNGVRHMKTNLNELFRM